jgi:hypothetical protein
MLLLLLLLMMTSLHASSNCKLQFMEMVIVDSINAVHGDGDR